jgi:LuxR family quorum sensing-dependent transcriptional regulator
MSLGLDNSKLDVIEALKKAPSVAKVKEVFREAVAAYGYTQFMCTVVPEPGQNAADAIIFEDWPDEWRRLYGRRRYYLRDPMILAMCGTSQPFTWAQALKLRNYAKRDRQIVYEASQWKMHQGFVVPIYGVGGEAHGLTMAGPAPRMDNEALSSAHFFSIFAHGRATYLKRTVPETPVPLRHGEREALHWVSRGKTDWEIGEILGISESAAHKRVENAKRKFGVPTRMQAVMAAVRQGSLRP